MAYTIEQGACVARLYKDGRGRKGGSQDSAAEGATAYLVTAAAAGRPWAATAGANLVIERFFVARMEMGHNPVASPETRLKARALAEYYGLDWLREILTAAGLLDPADVDRPAAAL